MKIGLNSYNELSREEIFGGRNNMKTRFSPVLEGAVNLLIPEYFSWDEQTQDKFRMFMTSDLKFRFHQFILKEAFGIEVADDDAFENAWGDMPNHDTTKFNAILLPLYGPQKF